MSSLPLTMLEIGQDSGKPPPLTEVSFFSPHLAGLNHRWYPSNPKMIGALPAEALSVSGVRCSSAPVKPSRGTNFPGTFP